MGITQNIYSKAPVWLQHAMVSAYGYGWRQRRFGGIFKQEYKKAKERESFSKEQWAHYTEEQLQKIVMHAYRHVPFYRRNFIANGITENAIKNISCKNIQLLPLLSKEALRQFGKTELLSKAREKKGAFFSSSGSSGTPVEILYSPAMHQRWFALYERSVRNWAGVSSFIPRAMIGGRKIIPMAQDGPPYYRYNYFEKQLYLSAYHINEKNAGNYAKGILKYGAAYMTGYAMSNFFLADILYAQKVQMPEMKAILTSSEKLTAEMRNTFTKVYGCKTYDSWGSIEACGLVTECGHGSLHINPDAGFIEILDNDMRPVSHGNEGQVYCTSFLNYDQPLIRYAIGDNFIASNKICSCGRNMPVIEEISGRNEDVLYAVDGSRMVRFHTVFYELASVKKAQVIQEDATHIMVKIIPDEKLSAADAQLIKSRLTYQLGNVDIVIQETDNIPLTANGKFKAVISKIR